MPTAKEIAEWMVGKLEERGRIYQEPIVRQIRELFSQEFSYKNKNGNWAISTEVLKEFRKMTEDYVVRERSSFSWRKRTDRDKLGRSKD